MVMIFLLVMPSVCLANNLMEYRLKALYILRLADFITWPKSSERTHFTVCIDLHDAVAKELQKIEAPLVKSLPVVVIQLPQKQNIQQCQIVYLTKESFNLIFTEKPVLTVSSELDFAEQGGMIEFFLEGDKVKMKVNLFVANKVGLQLSSKLIRLMQRVKSADEK